MKVSKQLVFKLYLNITKKWLATVLKKADMVLMMEKHNIIFTCSIDLQDNHFLFNTEIAAAYKKSTI